MNSDKTIGQAESRYHDSKGRQYFYDNAKFILIVFVVLAHFISPFKTDREWLHVVWRMINNLHMPTLIFISGFFAKSYIRPDGSIKVQRTFSYIMLYIFAQAAVSLFELFVMKEKIGPSLVSARSSLWFLQCLAIWYLVLPFFEKFNPAVLLPASIITGLLMGYDSNAFNVLAIQRVIVHFPFFMAGYFCTPQLISKLFTKKSKIIAICFIAFSILIYVFCFRYFTDKIITCNYPYSKISVLDKVPYLLRWVPRAVFYFFAIGLGASFLALVPRQKTFFTVFGSRTLQVYIIHRFPYLLWSNGGLGVKFNDVPGIVPIVAVAAIALTFLLSLKIFSYPFNAVQGIKIKPFLDKRKIKE